MSKTIYYHIGILVRDYKEAIAHYSKTLGINFTEPTNSLTFIGNPDTQQTEELTVIAAYSMTGPPYLELLQAGGNSIFSENNAD